MDYSFTFSCFLYIYWNNKNWDAPPNQPAIAIEQQRAGRFILAINVDFEVSWCLLPKILSTYMRNLRNVGYNLAMQYRSPIGLLGRIEL